MLRNFQVIGEAVKKVSDDLKRRNPQVPWREIAGMRDRLVHGYFEVDLDIVWAAVARHVPSLHRDVIAMLDSWGDP